MYVKACVQYCKDRDLITTRHAVIFTLLNFNKFGLMMASISRKVLLE